MVEVALYVTLVAFKVSLCVGGILGEGFVAVAHSVGLDIGLGHYIYTVLVAEVIPQCVIGVVTCAHCVDVELLHELDVLKHAVERHYITSVGVELVTVGTLEENGLSVDKKL